MKKLTTRIEDELISLLFCLFLLGSPTSLPADDAPRITSPDWASGTVGMPFTYNITATTVAPPNAVQWPVSSGGNDHWYEAVLVQHEFTSLHKSLRRRM